MRPELASSGATPLCRASWASLWKRPIGPISASSLAAVSAPAAGQLEQCRRSLGGPLLELTVELADRARERAAARDQLAGEAYLQLCWLAGEPAADAIKLRWPVECFRGHGEGAVELVQVPAQSLLRPAPLVDEIIAVVDQQLQLAKRLLVRARSAQPRLPQSGARHGERVDRVRLAAQSACTTLRCHQLRRHAHELFAGAEQFALERTGQLAAVLERPQPTGR